jgi:hypothetical protein
VNIANYGEIYVIFSPASFFLPRRFAYSPQRCYQRSSFYVPPLVRRPSFAPIQRTELYLFQYSYHTARQILVIFPKSKDVTVVYVDWVNYVSKLWPWTGLLFMPRMIYEHGTVVEWYWQGKTKELEENPAAVPLCIAQIPHGPTGREHGCPRWDKRDQPPELWHWQDFIKMKVVVFRDVLVFVQVAFAIFGSR